MNLLNRPPDVTSIMSSNGDRVLNLPIHGFHWRIDDAWLLPEIGPQFVEPTFDCIWQAYFQPLPVNVVRFHVNIMAYDLWPTTEAARRQNAVLVNRLVNFCRYADVADVWLMPMLMGTGRYRQGKEQEFPTKVYCFLQNFIRTLKRHGLERLYSRLAFYQIEDEMNHPTRHALWPVEVFTRMLLKAGREVRRAEQDEGMTSHVPLVVIFSADWMFVKDIFRRPWQYVGMIRSQRPYAFRPPPDLQAFLEDDVIEVIGVDSFPGIYCPFTRFEFAGHLVRHLCECYGLHSAYRKRWMVTETGYATAHIGHQGETNQLRFYQTVFRDLSDYYWQGGGREAGFLGLMWYCFNDKRLRPVLYPWQEYRFGVIEPIPRTSWFATYPARPKPAWRWLCDGVTESEDWIVTRPLETIRGHVTQVCT